MAKVLVIGGGFAGCCAAQLLAKKGHKITLVEQDSFLGGGCKTFYKGRHPFTFGPRHFLTQDERLFAFLNQYVPMRRIPEHEFITYVERDEAFYHFPIHQDEIPMMPDRVKIETELSERNNVEQSKNLEEYWIRSVGPTLYSKFIESYSKKMWNISSNIEIDDFAFSPKGVALKTGSKAAWTSAISAFPIKQNGYDDYFDIATKEADVHLNTFIESYDVANHRVKVAGEWHTYDIIVSSTSPEVLMNNQFGHLRWIGRDFINMVIPTPEVLPKNVYFLYYANSEPFTRIVEYKKFYNYESPHTLIGLEIPSSNGKLYPYPIKKEQEKAQMYLDNLPKDVYSIGRAGTYRYIDIDDIIKHCLELAEVI